MQRFPERARHYGVTVLNRALEGVTGTTAVHVCFGYAAVVPNKPSRYSFLTELAESSADHVSIEAAQPKLDLSVLREFPSKKMIVGVLDLGDSITITHFANGFAPGWHAAHVFILWVK